MNVCENSIVVNDIRSKIQRLICTLYIQGTSGFEKQVESSLQMAECLAEKLRQRDGFQLVIEVYYQALATAF